MDAQFRALMEAAYQADLKQFTALLDASPELVTAPSTDPADSPNLIQFVVVEGGLGKISHPAQFVRLLLMRGSTTAGQLVAAASVNARELIDVLVEAGVPLDDGAPWTAVEESLYWGHRDLAAYLINKLGAPVETLCAAAMLGDVGRTASFFRDGTLSASVLPIHFPWGCVDGSTADDAIAQALLLSVRNQQFETASFVLAQGANIDAIVRGHHEQCTALHFAATLDDTQAVDWLIDQGARGDIKDPRFSATAAEWATHQGKQAMAAHLRAKLGA